MPFGSAARPLTSAITLPTPGLIVAQEAPLHYYYALANELTEQAHQWEEARASVTPQMAFDLADMTMKYPDLPASVLTGAVAGGIPLDHPALQSLNDRMGYARTLNPVATAGQNILSVPFDFIRGTVRLATTAFTGLYEEALPRHTRQVVGMTQGMSALEARQASGESYAVSAWDRFWNDPIGNLTPLPSKPSGQVNLGSGWLPKSNLAESDSAEVQMLMGMGIPEANAIAQVQQGYGDPLTQMSYDQAQTGITFDDGMSISPGRLVAKGVGLEAGTMPFHIVSGAADFGSQLFLDPTNLALWGLGKARLANKMLVGGAARRGIWGVEAEKYLAGTRYREATETISRLHLNEDVANALNVKHLSDNVEGFSVRKLVADATEANTPEKVDAVLRPYFGTTEGSLPMFSQVPTPRSILNPSDSRRTLGQVLGGKFEGAAGDVGGTFGLKAAVRHNLEGSWMGRMFSKMPGGMFAIDDLDHGYEEVRAYANSMGMSPEDSHPYLQAFARLADGDGTGARQIVDRMNKWFVDQIPGASDELKNGFLKNWHRWEQKRGYWVNEVANAQWFPDVETYGVVDGNTVVVSKTSAQQLNELYNNTVMLIDPRQIRQALSDEGILKIARLTSREAPVPGTSAAMKQNELVDRMMVGIFDSYMQKVWKPFVLLRVAWPVRVVFEEQLRMAASGLDSMFSHPISWFAYAFTGKMNRTLTGEALEVIGRSGQKTKMVYDFTPGGTFDSFANAMAGKGGPFLDQAGKSLGQINYVNVWQQDPGFAEAWLWQLAKNHQDPVQAYLRGNGIDATVEWLQKGAGKSYLKKLIDTAGPEKAAFLGDGQSAGRIRWYVEGLHARSVKLAGGDYVYWQPHADSAVIPGYKGGWLTSSDRPLTPDELATHKLDPHGPVDPPPLSRRSLGDDGTGPSPVDGLPEGGKPRGPSSGADPMGTEPLPMPTGASRVGIESEIEALATERANVLKEMLDYKGSDLGELSAISRRAKELENQINTLRGQNTKPPVEVPIQARVNQFDRPFSEYDPVKVRAQSGKTKDKAFNTTGYHITSNGFDSNRAFSEYFNSLFPGSSYRRTGLDSIDLTEGTFGSELAAIDDLARLFMGPTGVVDDAAITKAFNQWAEYAQLDAAQAQYMVEDMVHAINVRHQQQLDLMNYVYPGRVSRRGNALEELTDAAAYKGIKLTGEALTPEQIGELRFIHRFIDTLMSNETGWGRNASMTVDHVFDNFGAEFPNLTYDSPLIKRILDAAEAQQRARPSPTSLSRIEPKGLDDLADIPELGMRNLAGEAVDSSGNVVVPGAAAKGPHVITGFASAEGGVDNLGLYTSMGSGRAAAAVTIDDYATMDLAAMLEYAVNNIGEPRLREIIEDLALGAKSSHEHHDAVAQYLVRLLKETDMGRGITPPGPNGAWIFQGQIGDGNQALKGVSSELKSFFNEIEGAWFDRTPTGTLMDQTERRIVMGGYDGVWSPSDRAGLVTAMTEGGAFTTQGSESLAKVVEILQARDGGLTRGWLDAFGQEIASAGARRRPDKPLPVMSLFELETAETRSLADEFIQLAAGFNSKDIAADELVRLLKPGATVDAHTGVEARLFEIADELQRRANLDVSIRGADATANFSDEQVFDDFVDAILNYAEFSEMDPDDLWHIVDWMGEFMDRIDPVWTPVRSTWPRHTIDEFTSEGQPHLLARDMNRGWSPSTEKAARRQKLIDDWEALPDDAEVWVFHSTDPMTARRMLVDGIDPRNKPLHKLSNIGDPAYMPGKGMDSGTYVSADPRGLIFYGQRAAKEAGAAHDTSIVAIKIRKGDLKASGEALEAAEAGAAWPAGEGSTLWNSLTNSGTGATFDIPIPPGNIKLFGVESLSTAENKAATIGEIVNGNIKAGANLSDDATAAVRLAERAGYRVEVVGAGRSNTEIWIMDRDRAIRIVDMSEHADEAPSITITEYFSGGGQRGRFDQEATSYEQWESRSKQRIGREVINDPEIRSVSDAVTAILGDAKGIPPANAPRRGFRYLLETPYGEPRLKQNYGPHYADGTQIDLDNLSIMGIAKDKLKATLPDAPKRPTPPTPPEPPSRPLAIGPGKQPPALGSGGDVPSGGFPSSGGVNDELFQGTHYKITRGQSENGRRMLHDGVIKDPATGEDMNLFSSGNVDDYAADLDGLPSRYDALRENLDSAPPVLTGPNPEYAAQNVGIWDKAIDQMFYYLMSVPTNRLSRAPAFKQFYLERVLHLRSYADDATRRQLDKAISKDLGVSDFEKWRRDPTSALPVVARGETTEGIKMTFDQIDQIAKSYALEQTKGLLYDMTQKHDASDVLRNVFPFAEAWGEIITAWSKIMWENPRMFRRAQQGVEAAREEGWFYNDGNGNEVFAYPGSGFVTNAMLGTGEKSSVQLTGTTAGVNLALGQYVPGFGPVVQVPASVLLPNMPKFDAIRKFLMPYGDEEVQTPGDIINLGLPAWFEKALIAIGTGNANYQRLHNNTVMDVYKVLAAEHPEKLNNDASARALMEEASRKASTISWLRAGAAMFSPTSPQIEYNVADAEGTMWQMQSMTAEYYRILRTHDFDQQLALEDFIRRFGFGEDLPGGLGVAATFITPKSIQVEERGTTSDAFAWQRNNMDLFKDGAFPYTAAYAMQDLAWDPFDYGAYLDGLKTGAREPTTPDEWLMRRNKLVGNIAFDHARSQVEGRTDPAARLWLRDARIKLANEYPGFDVDIAGLPVRPDTQSQIMELEKWVDERRLNQSNAGQGVQVYLAMRRRAEAAAYSRGLMPDSWKTAASMAPWRNWMRQGSEAIMGVFPEFGQLWFDVFRWELTEDETPETLTLGGMTF